MKPLTEATAALLAPIKLAPQDRLKLSCDKDMERFRAQVVSADADSYGLRHFASHAARNDWPQRIPERKKLDGTDCWELAATDTTAQVLRACWPDDRILFADAGTRVLFLELLAQSAVQDWASEQYAAFKLGGVYQPSDLEVHPDFPLATYQNCATSIARRSSGYGLLMEQGCGKTPCVIAEVCDASKSADFDRDMFKALIVCPKNVRTNWVREFERFATQPGKICVLRGGTMARVTKLIEAMHRGPGEEDCRFTACVISYELMVRMWEYLRDVRWDLSVLDEAHMIKRPETARSKTAMKLRDVSERRRVLTGTPVSNTPLDLYALFEFMGKGWSGFKTWKNFKDFYGVYEKQGEDGWNKLVGVQNLPFMKERLAKLSFIITKKEALPELPDKVYDVAEVEMSKPQAEAYAKLAEQLAFEIEAELEDVKAITVNNVLTKLLRLAQICSGYISWDKRVDPLTLEVSPALVEFFEPNAKVEWVVETLREKGPKEKTIIWSCFVPCIHALAKRLRQEFGEDSGVVYYGQTSDAEREEAERRFNFDPSCRWLIGNPGAGGVGLNLPGSDVSKWDTPEDDGCSADHVIHLACDWSYVKRAQCEDRNHGKKRCRIGHNVRHTDLVVPETLDEEIRVRVLNKKKVALEISDIREILAAVITGLKGVESED